MNEGHARRLRVLLAALAVAAHAAFVWNAFRGLPRYSDEIHHMRQIDRFCGGDLSVDPKLTTIPGYHAVSAFVGRLLHDCSLPPMRAVNVVFGMMSVAVFFAAASASGVAHPVMRTLQYYFLPILLPYHFLVYTDTVALLALLASAALLFRGRHTAAGVVGALSVLLRQTNVVWLLLLCALTLLEDGDWRKLRAFVPGLVVFLLFVAINGGVAMGDQRAHHAGLHLGNVFFLLFVFCLLFLPRNLAVLWAHRDRLLDGWLGAALAVVCVVFLLSFGVDHAYNRIPGFLRNDLLLLLDERPLLKVAFFVPVAGALATLAVDRLRRGSFHALYAVALVSLLPVKLIDHRYDVTPLAFFLLFRRDDSPFVESLGLALSVVVSSFFLDGIARGAFAL